MKTKIKLKNNIKGERICINDDLTKAENDEQKQIRLLKIGFNKL